MIIPVCSHCNSRDVLADAYAEWCTEEGNWILHSAYDEQSICRTCDTGTKLNWVKEDQVIDTDDSNDGEALASAGFGTDEDYGGTDDGA